MNINIPFPAEAQDDLRKMFTALAKEVIAEVKNKELEIKPYMDTKEACKYIGCAFTTMQKYKNMGLKSISLEGKVYFSKKTIDDFMAENEK